MEHEVPGSFDAYYKQQELVSFFLLCNSWANRFNGLLFLYVAGLQKLINSMGKKNIHDGGEKVWIFKIYTFRCLKFFLLMDVFFIKQYNF